MKFMRNLDGVSNLEAVVIHDLRDIGVKIPKIRKQIHSVVSVSTRASGKGCVCGTGTRILVAVCNCLIT